MTPDQGDGPSIDNKTEIFSLPNSQPDFSLSSRRMFSSPKFEIRSLTNPGEVGIKALPFERISKRKSLRRNQWPKPSNYMLLGGQFPLIQF